MATHVDAALHALLAGAEALAPLPDNFSGKVVFLRAMGGAVLNEYDPQKSWSYEQSFAPHALRLKDMGYQVSPAIDIAPASADRVFYLATRFAEENEATLARGWQMVKSGGWLVAALHNDLGGKRLGGLLKRLPSAGCESISKFHCRAVGVHKPADYQSTADEQALLAEWLEGAKPHTVVGTPLLAAPGMFSWRGVDVGSKLLIDTLPKSLAGRGADIACGWGYLSWAALARARGISQLALIEAEKRALDFAEQSVKSETAQLSFHWADATRPLPVSGLDFAIMNPPAHELMQSAADATAAIFARTADALKSGGSLWLVANRHLPYERTLESLFSSVSQVSDEHGFKVLEARK